MGPQRSEKSPGTPPETPPRPGRRAARAARRSAPPVPDAHTALIALAARLHDADLTPTAVELADALWLSRHVPPAVRADRKSVV